MAKKYYTYVIVETVEHTVTAHLDSDDPVGAAWDHWHQTSPVGEMRTAVADITECEESLAPQGARDLT